MDDARSRSPFARTLRVLTRCDSTAALVERYAREVSHAGVFLRTREVFEVGAAVRFEYLLSDGRCALAGEGHVAFCRAEAQVGAPRAGVGVSISRLRHGDRAVVERMTAARGGALSRFERPEGTSSMPPSNPPLQAASLFADVKISGGDAPDAVAAYLSADLTNDLPTVRPPPSGPAPRPMSDRELRASVGELADQLEPAPPRPSALDPASRDADATLEPVQLERDAQEPAAAAAAATGATPVGAPARSDDHRATGAAPQPPRSRLLPWLMLVVLLALGVLAFQSGALEPWLPR